MRKEEFFEILGEIDDRLVEEAKKPAGDMGSRKEESGNRRNGRSKNGIGPVNWKRLGAMAACFALVCIALGQIPFMGRHNESAADSPMTEAEAPAEEAAPMEEASPMEETEASAEEASPMEEAEAPAEEAAMEGTEEDTEGEISAEETPEAVPGDIAPMIYVNDTLYIASPAQEGYAEWREEFSYLGRIESETASDREPEENFQANDPIAGCEVYQYGEDIVVKIDGKYWLYVEYGGVKR